MKKLAAVISVFLILSAAFAACAGNEISEQGDWKLEFFSDGTDNYSVGEKYGDLIVSEDFYTCSFGGGKYAVKKQGETVQSGGYASERMKDGTVCLTVEQGEGENLWTCGVRTEADGKKTLFVTARIGNHIVSFIPAV